MAWSGRGWAELVSCVLLLYGRFTCMRTLWKQRELVKGTVSSSVPCTSSMGGSLAAWFWDD